MKLIKWVYDKRSGDHIINFNFLENRLYDDWFIRIHQEQLLIGINRDTMEEDYESR